MFDTLTSRFTRRRVALGAVAAVLVGSLVVLVLLATQGPRAASVHHRAARSAASHATPQSSSGVSPSSAPTTASSSGSSAALPPLPRTDDPVLYARAVAEVLFGAEPGAVSRAEFLEFWREQLPTVVYSDGAVKGLTLAVQNQDAIDNLTSSWIPPQVAWSAEASEDTTNSFAITSVSVPDYWIQAVSNGTFRDPGLRMERVMGVLTQTYGTGPTQRATAARPVIIDLVLLCGPTQPGGCRLLAPQQSAAAGATGTG